MTTLASDPTDGSGTDSATAAELVETARDWAGQGDISARWVLVTILGDTVAPLGGTVWLADVFALAAPFGFNERLVRTSMFRLGADGWVDSERIGRRSRYSLTRYGRDETASAESRIYRRTTRPWDGSWTLAFLANDSSDAVRHLRWRGFARMAAGVYAHANDEVAATRHLLASLELEPIPPVALAHFDGDGEAPLAGAPFRAESGLDDAEVAYLRFLDRYQPLAAELTRPDGTSRPELEPVEAFALRTMVVHDLRRARLRDPDLPTPLLPQGWVGHRAVELAADLYRMVSDPAWRWVETVTGLTPDPTIAPLANRFCEETTP